MKFSFNSLYFKLISANKVAKIRGVKYGTNPKFATKNFGSEPYLIEVGDNFETSSSVSFITHDGGLGVLRNLYSEFNDIDMFDKIIVGDNVFIGMNVTILYGTKMGNNIIVGAGSVVKGELKSNSVYAGVPAKYICSIDEYKNKNKEKFMHTFLMDPPKKEQTIKTKFKVDEF